ncbi:hypothetical protein Golob_000698 [Gossypium lobatum]|uniref:Uncharacterized protein n=1 Tax=Gossypium lobatum TaxID=34289 RepID=A0A7J8N954_9ROSI|nr:hypothetical protein [Gossypium lobatum]
MELPMFTVPTDLLYSIFTVSVDLSLFRVYCPNGLISMDAIESFFYGLTPIRHLEVLSYDAIESSIHYGGLTKPSTDILRIIIPENACILCITMTAGTELAGAYSPDTESEPCLNPSMADHPLGLAIDHRLCKLLPHQLANQTRAPPQVSSSFCSSAYGVLAAVSSYCSPPKGRFLRITHQFST